MSLQMDSQLSKSPASVYGWYKPIAQFGPCGRDRQRTAPGCVGDKPKRDFFGSVREIREIAFRFISILKSTVEVWKQFGSSANDALGLFEINRNAIFRKRARDSWNRVSVYIEFEINGRGLKIIRIISERRVRFILNKPTDAPARAQQNDWIALVIKPSTWAKHFLKMFLRRFIFHIGPYFYIDFIIYTKRLKCYCVFLYFWRRFISRRRLKKKNVALLNRDAA